MDVVSFCPLRVSALPWQPRPGTHALTVICKATFELRPGESPLASEQQAPCETDVHVSDDPGWGLRAASDMVPFKRTADVLVVGHTHAPHGQPVTSLVARLSVGTLDKALDVHADRTWSFGPIAPSSPARAALLGRHAAGWDHRTWNTRPLPADFDGAFFNAAPLDQQMPELRGDETIVLEHLHPVHPRLTTRLARIIPQATVRRETDPAQVQPARLRCDTLCVDAGRGIATLVWRGVVLLADPAERGTIAVTAEGTATPATSATRNAPAVPAPQFAQGSAHATIDDGTGTLVAGLALLPEAARPVLPFVQDKPSIQTRSSDASDTSEARANERIDDGTGTLVAGLALRSSAVTDAVLPFGAGTQRFPEPGFKNQTQNDDVTQMADRDVPAGAEPPQERPPQWHPDEPPERDELTEAARPLDALPPPMIGPLAAFERLPAGKATVDATPAAQQVASVESIAAPIAPPESEPAQVELTIEQVAEIAAEIAEGRVVRAKVLEANSLRERIWRENERRWMKAIDDEASRGTHTLRGAYDAAYVARVEQFRGPITLEEYARIMAGIERGRANQVLDALRIQQQALMPIARLWTKKVAKDMKLADAATRALRAARSA